MLLSSLLVVAQDAEDLEMSSVVAVDEVVGLVVAWSSFSYFFLVVLFLVVFIPCLASNRRAETTGLVFIFDIFLNLLRKFLTFGSLIPFLDVDTHLFKFCFVGMEITFLCQGFIRHTLDLSSTQSHCL